jgi:hypothetical protein
MSEVFIGILRGVGFLLLKLIDAAPLAVAMWETAEHERSLPRAVRRGEAASSFPRLP